MEPKEKAIKLRDKFIDYAYGDTLTKEKENAKECALICVDEIIKDRETDYKNPDITDYDREGVEYLINYWNNVKKEINKL